MYFMCQILVVDMWLPLTHVFTWIHIILMNMSCYMPHLKDLHGLLLTTFITVTI
jgi:hypothetical protein